MKANDLRTTVEKEQLENVVPAVKDERFYKDHREEAMESYLKDVGPISEYINKNLEAIKKNGKEK